MVEKEEQKGYTERGTMKKIIFTIILTLIIGVAGGYYIGYDIGFERAVQTAKNDPTDITLDPAIVEHIQSKADLIVLNQPRPNDDIRSPLTITGMARGNWFFEASFPIVLVDWDGRIIAQHYATAQGEWMTEDFVPFTSTLEFERPDTRVSNRGALILQRDNPSGLPENDDALEIPIFFE